MEATEQGRLKELEEMAAMEAELAEDWSKAGEDEGRCDGQNSGKTMRPIRRTFSPKMFGLLIKLPYYAFEKDGRWVTVPRLIRRMMGRITAFEPS